jgi:hypothetical protein
MCPAIKWIQTYCYSHQAQNLQVSGEKTMHIFLLSPTHATCSAHFMLLDLITIMWCTANIKKFLKKQQTPTKCCIIKTSIIKYKVLQTTEKMRNAYINEVGKMFGTCQLED